MLSDIEIAENCNLKDIRQIAKKLGLGKTNSNYTANIRQKSTLPAFRPRQN